MTKMGNFYIFPEKMMHMRILTHTLKNAFHQQEVSERRELTEDSRSIAMEIEGISESSSHWWSAQTRAPTAKLVPRQSAARKFVAPPAVLLESGRTARRSP